MVANPPFSYKSWSNGVNIPEEQQAGGRFYGYGVPPSKNGDYAFLMHILKSLKSKGKGAVILPHGVLFRGNAEAEIRQNLIRRGVIKGIIGLPANLFYGTGIPACLIVLDKENAENRKGIFMIDAGKDFMKDGNKNRLREQDIHKMVDVFNKQLEIPKYSRMVPVAEIEEKEFNLNLPRYIDSTEPEDIQNIEAHLQGDIPNADVDALQNFWAVYPSLKSHLFGKSKREGFSKLNIEQDEIKQSIFSHPEFTAYGQKTDIVFNIWKNKIVPLCLAIDADTKPKKFIHTISEDLLQTFSNLQLIDPYDVYQHLMRYWMETMQDDCYLLVGEGWKAGNEVEWTKKEFEGKLIPKQLLIQRYFDAEQKALEQLEATRDALVAQLEEMEEEHIGEEGLFAALDKVNKANVNAELKTVKAELKPLKKSDADFEELVQKKAVFEQYVELADAQTEANKLVKEAKVELDKKLLDKYTTLTEADIKTLVVEDKWMTTIEATVKGEMQRISQRLTQRIKELAERYDATLTELLLEVNQWEEKVMKHLEKMGY